MNMLNYSSNSFERSASVPFDRSMEFELEPKFLSETSLASLDSPGLRPLSQSTFIVSTNIYKKIA